MFDFLHLTILHENENAPKADVCFIQSSSDHHWKRNNGKFFPREGEISLSVWYDTDQFLSSFTDKTDVSLLYGVYEGVPIISNSKLSGRGNHSGLQRVEKMLRIILCLSIDAIVLWDYLFETHSLIDCNFVGDCIDINGDNHLHWNVISPNLSSLLLLRFNGIRSRIYGRLNSLIESNQCIDTFGDYFCLFRLFCFSLSNSFLRHFLWSFSLRDGCLF